MLARVTKVTHPPPDPAAVMQLRAQISQQMEGDLSQTLAQGARADTSVDIHAQTLQQAVGDTQ